MDDAIASGEMIYNIGNPDNEITVRALADLVKNMIGSSSKVVYADAKEIHGELYEEAESFQKNPVLVNAPAIGWKPQVDLRDLIRETIEYYRPIVTAGQNAA